MLVQALAAKLNVSNVVTKNWYSEEVLKNSNSNIEEDSGGVSSQIISPPAEHTHTFGDLDRKNYSAVVSNINRAAFMEQSISSLVSYKTGTWINKMVVIIHNLYTRSVLASAAVHDYQAIAQLLVQNYSSKFVFTDK